MVEAETRRFLLVNRLGKYQDKFGDEGITDLNSLNKYCMTTSVQDLEMTIGMKPIQARALIDLMTNESHPRSPRAKPPQTNFPDDDREEGSDSPPKSPRRKPPPKIKATKVEISPELKRYLVANKCGGYCDGLVSMEILTLTKLTEFCEDDNAAATSFMASPLALTPRQAKELISLLTNPRNAASPRAKSSIRNPAAEAAARVLKEEELIKAEEKRALIKLKGEKITIEREKRLQKEAEIAAEKERIEQEYKEQMKEVEEEKFSEGAMERQRVADEKKKEEEKAKYLAKADRILELQLAKEKALQVRDVRAEEKRRLEAKRLQMEEEKALELSQKLSKLQGMVRRKKATEAAVDRKKSRNQLVEMVQRANRHRVARKELYFRQLKRALSCDFEYGETPSKSLVYRVDSLETAMAKFRKLHRVVQKPVIIETPNKEKAMNSTTDEVAGTEEVEEVETPKIEQVSEMVESVDKKPIEERVHSSSADLPATATHAAVKVIDTSQLSAQDLLIYSVEERLIALKTRQKDVVLTLKSLLKLENFVLPPKTIKSPEKPPIDLDRENTTTTELSSDQKNQISALEAAKVLAVEKEDFQTAQALKFEIDELNKAFNMNAIKTPDKKQELSSVDSTTNKEEEEEEEKEEPEDLASINGFIAALQTVITAADGSVPLKSLTSLYSAKTKLLKLQEARTEILRNQYALQAQKEAEIEAKKQEEQQLLAEEEERKKLEEEERIKKIEADAKARAKAAEEAAMQKLKDLEEDRRLAEIAEKEAAARKLKEIEELEKEKEKLEKKRLADIAEKKRRKKEEAAMEAELQKAAEEAERLRIEEEKAEIAEQKAYEAKERIREAKAKQAEEAQRRQEAAEEEARLAKEAVKKPVVVMKQLKTTFKVGQRVYGCHSDDEEWYVAHVHAVRVEDEAEYYDLIYEGFEEEEGFEENKTIEEVCHPREFDDEIEEEEKPQRRRSSVKAPVMNDKENKKKQQEVEEEILRKKFKKEEEIKQNILKNKNKNDNDNGEDNNDEKPEQKLVKKSSSSSSKPLLGRQGSFNQGTKRRGSKKEDSMKEAARIAEEEEAKKKEEEEAKKLAETSLMNLVQDTTRTLPQKLNQLIELNEKGILKAMGDDAFNNAKTLILSATHLHKQDELSSNNGSSSGGSGGGGGNINLSDLTPKEIKKMEKEMKKRRKTELKVQAKEEKEMKKRRETQLKQQAKEEKEEKKRQLKEEKEEKKLEKGRKSVAARLSVFW